MKKYMNDHDRALEAQTLSIARMVAHLANLELDTKIPILPPGVCGPLDRTGSACRHRAHDPR